MTAVSGIFEATGCPRGQQLSADDFLPLLVSFIFYNLIFNLVFTQFFIIPGACRFKMWFYWCRNRSRVHVGSFTTISVKW